MSEESVNESKVISSNSLQDISVLSTQQKQNLASWGLPDAVLKKYEALGVVSMFPWQVECLSNANVLAGGNLVYSAPTSAGKTLVAEMLTIKTVLEKKRKVIIILPFVSVVREKMFYFQKLLSHSGVRVEGLMGNHSLPGGFKNVDIAICTIEKANSLINRLLEEGSLHKIGAMVVDELHLLGDPFRGYLLELLLTKVLYMCKSKEHVKIQIIGMSATLPNLQLLAAWLDADLYRTDFRPVPLKEYLKIGATVYGSELKKLYDIKASKDIKDDPDHVVQLCLETLLNGHSALIFCASKNWCEKLAQHVAKEFRNIGCSGSEVGLQLRDQLNSDAIAETLELLRRSPVGLDKFLKRTVAFGVAFHHAGLTIDERDIIESSFRSGVLRVLVATSTLSSGVNLPARRVIVRSPMFFGKPIDPQVYRQMVGRAGRMGRDTAGESFLICNKVEANAGKHLIQSALNPVESCLGQGELAASLKRAILEVIASGVASTPEEVTKYTNCTLLATTDSDLQNPISACVKFLEKNEFIRLQKDEGSDSHRYVPTPLGQACLAASIAPDQGLQLFDELQRARQCFVLDTDLHIIYEVTPYSVCSQWGELDWLHVMNLWEQLPVSMQRVGELVGVEERFMMRAVRGTLTLKTSQQIQKMSVHRRFYTALALHDLVNEVPLTEVAMKYGCTRGMLQSLQQSAATFAGMVTAFCRRLGWSSVELLVSQFQDRLQFGVQRELCDLMRLDGLNGPRARALFNEGITSLGDLAVADVSDVENALHRAVPFESSKELDGETSFDVKQRNKLRNVWVTGREGLTEREAAVLLISEARAYLQKEFGLVDVKWESPGGDTSGYESLSHSHSSHNSVQISAKNDDNRLAECFSNASTENSEHAFMSVESFISALPGSTRDVPEAVDLCSTDSKDAKQVPTSSESSSNTVHRSTEHLSGTKVSTDKAVSKHNKQAPTSAESSINADTKPSEQKPISAVSSTIENSEYTKNMTSTTTTEVDEKAATCVSVCVQLEKDLIKSKIKTQEPLNSRSPNCENENPTFQTSESQIRKERLSSSLLSDEDCLSTSPNANGTGLSRFTITQKSSKLGISKSSKRVSGKISCTYLKKNSIKQKSKSLLKRQSKLVPNTSQLHCKKEESAKNVASPTIQSCDNKISKEVHEIPSAIKVSTNKDVNKSTDYFDSPLDISLSKLHEKTQENEKANCSLKEVNDHILEEKNGLGDDKKNFLKTFVTSLRATNIADKENIEVNKSFGEIEALGKSDALSPKKIADTENQSVDSKSDRKPFLKVFMSSLRVTDNSSKENSEIQKNNPIELKESQEEVDISCDRRILNISHENDCKRKSSDFFSSPKSEEKPDPVIQSQDGSPSLFGDSFVVDTQLDEVLLACGRKEANGNSNNILTNYKNSDGKCGVVSKIEVKGEDKSDAVIVKKYLESHNTTKDYGYICRSNKSQCSLPQGIITANDVMKLKWGTKCENAVETSDHNNLSVSSKNGSTHDLLKPSNDLTTVHSEELEFDSTPQQPPKKRRAFLKPHTYQISEKLLSAPRNKQVRSAKKRKISSSDKVNNPGKDLNKSKKLRINNEISNSTIHDPFGDTLTDEEDTQVSRALIMNDFEELNVAQDIENVDSEDKDDIISDSFLDRAFETYLESDPDDNENIIPNCDGIRQEDYVNLSRKVILQEKSCNSENKSVTTPQKIKPKNKILTPVKFVPIKFQTPVKISSHNKSASPITLTSANKIKSPCKLTSEYKPPEKFTSENIFSLNNEMKENSSTEIAVDSKAQENILPEKENKSFEHPKHRICLEEMKLKHQPSIRSPNLNDTTNDKEKNLAPIEKINEITDKISDVQCLITNSLLEGTWEEVDVKEMEASRLEDGGKIISEFTKNIQTCVEERDSPSSDIAPKEMDKVDSVPAVEGVETPCLITDSLLEGAFNTCWENYSSLKSESQANKEERTSELEHIRIVTEKINVHKDQTSNSHKSEDVKENGEKGGGLRRRSPRIAAYKENEKKEKEDKVKNSSSTKGDDPVISKNNINKAGSMISSQTVKDEKTSRPMKALNSETYKNAQPGCSKLINHKGDHGTTPKTKLKSTSKDITPINKKINKVLYFNSESSSNDEDDANDLITSSQGEQETDKRNCGKMEEVILKVSGREIRSVSRSPAATQKYKKIIKKPIPGMSGFKINNPSHGKNSASWDSVNIVDVCGHEKIWRTFQAELDNNVLPKVAFAVACEQYVQPSASLPSSGVIGARIIGLRQRKPASIKQKHSLHSGERLVTGIALCFGGRDIFFISLKEGTGDEKAVSIQCRLEVIQLLLNKNTVFCAFDLKEHFKVLVRCCGVKLNIHAGHDPKVADWMLEPEGREKNFNAMVLQYCGSKASNLTDSVGTSFGVGSPSLDWRNHTSSRLRASIEAVLTFEITEMQQSTLDEKNLRNIFSDIEMPTLLCLTRMELNGIGFDRDEAERLRDRVEEQLHVLEQHAYKLAGHSFSLTSSADIAKVLFRELGLTPGKLSNKQKHPSTSKEALLRIKDQHPLPRVILQWRKLNAVITKTLFPLLAPGRASGRMFTSSVIHTATGRISMHEPNLQNIPRDFEVVIDGNEGESLIPICMRLAFVPSPGNVFVSADYSQLELRLLAHLAKDSALCSILNSDCDVFRNIAASWNKIQEEQVTGEQRQWAKQVCYGIIYGMGARALGEQLDVDEEEAAVFMQTFKNTYTGVKKYLSDTVVQCRKEGYVETLSGRRRYLPSILSSNPAIKAQAERQAINSTVQGSAADVAKKAMILVESQLRNAGMVSTDGGFNNEREHSGIANLVLHLHDELLYEVSRDHAMEAARIIKCSLESAVNLSVKLPVKVKIGDSWGSIKEVSL